MPVSGDFGPLQEMLDGLYQGASGKIFEDITQACGNAAMVMVEESFERETDQNGNQWKPSQRVLKWGGKTLTLTRRLRSSFVLLHGPGFFVITNDTPYANIHQFGGTIRMPARRQTVEWNENGKFSKRGTGAKSLDFDVSEHDIIMPKRSFMPEDPVPDEWNKEFEREGEIVIRGALPT